MKKRFCTLQFCESIMENNSYYIYVFSAYLITFVIMVGMISFSWLKYKRSQKKLSKLKKKVKNEY